MRKLQKAVAVVTAICILVGIGLGIATRRSYVHTSATAEERLAYTLRTSELPSADSVEDTIRTYLSEAELVAKVRFTGEREDKYNAELSTVEVLEVYFGDETYTGQTIRIYEQFRFSDRYGTVDLITCFLPMQPQKEYYVFLKKKAYIDVYQQKLPYEEFRIYCGMFGGCFATENEPLPVVEAETLTWQEAAAYDFIYHNTEEFDSCMEQKNAVLSYFGIPYTYPSYDELLEGSNTTDGS